MTLFDDNGGPVDWTNSCLHRVSELVIHQNWRLIALGFVETSWVLQFAFWLEEVDEVIGILVKAGAYTDGLREAWEDGLDLQGAGYTDLLSSSLWAVIRFLHVF